MSLKDVRGIDTPKPYPARLLPTLRRQVTAATLLRVEESGNIKSAPDSADHPSRTPSHISRLLELAFIFTTCWCAFIFAQRLLKSPPTSRYSSNRLISPTFAPILMLTSCHLSRSIARNTSRRNGHKRNERDPRGWHI